MTKTEIPPVVASGACSAPDPLAVEAITYGYPGCQVGTDLDLTITAGSFTAIVGPNAVRQVHPAAGAQPIADSVRRPGGARRPRHRVVPVAARGSPIGPAAAELDRP